MYYEGMQQDITEFDLVQAKNPDQDEKQEDKDQNTVHKKPRIRLKELIDGTILVRDDIKKQLPYVLFLTFLGIIYIGNRFYAERLVRQINELKTEVSNLRSEQITTTAELMNISRPSEVEALVRERNLGLSESVDPPLKLIRK